MKLLCALTPGAGAPCALVWATGKNRIKTLIGLRTRRVRCQNNVAANSSLSGSTLSFSVLEAHPHTYTNAQLLLVGITSSDFYIIFNTVPYVTGGGGRNILWALQSTDWLSAPWRVCLCDANKGASNRDGLHVALKNQATQGCRY